MILAAKIAKWCSFLNVLVLVKTVMHSEPVVMVARVLAVADDHFCVPTSPKLPGCASGCNAYSISKTHTEYRTKQPTT